MSKFADLMRAHIAACEAAPKVARPPSRTCMTYWLPKIITAGLPVPRTALVELGEDECKDIWRVFDGQAVTGVCDPFLAKLKVAADSMGYPCFLRTGHTSAKHSWDDACYLRSRDDILGHVLTIIEYGEMTGIMGLPHNWWAVREFLPTMPVATCPAYNNMPVCREWRAFVRDDQVECVHPYWPLEALERGGVPDAAEVCLQLWLFEDEAMAGIREMASRAGKACGGYWSVDFLETRKGWYLTDMAEGEKSFHWPVCDKKA